VHLPTPAGASQGAGFNDLFDALQMLGQIAQVSSRYGFAL
jgi:hypothetical protein